MNLNDVVFPLVVLHASLLIVLLCPPPLDGIGCSLASVLTIDSPQSFLNRYGSFVAGDL
jgi:hypothetical protein